ncbi:hypothetical protein ACEWY4_017361 [Coilia grayii]|uniref:Uncharacterized protein n=1 Tax=Coilia grayii TaxID=363190 RepID=A0ABD1JGL6_9TELE
MFFCCIYLSKTDVCVNSSCSPEDVSGYLKEKLKKQVQNIREGIEETKKPLDEIYTKLFITQARAAKEHEICEMDSTDQSSHGKEIECNSIFQQDVKPRTVLTKGNAGIGKTVCIQKFVLDWVEGRANQNIKLMLVLPFRELSLLEGKYSLHSLLCELYPELTNLKDPKFYNSNETALIFDGLDESRFQLNFSKKLVADMNQITTVDVLISSLIKGKLLDSALLWITSRPAAAQNISAYIDQITEVQGFNDPQKEEYFHKKINNPGFVDKIISHIKSSRILYIMCQIPLFCWLAATVFQKMLEISTKELPKNLTSMYCHFLLIETYRTHQKNHGSDERDNKKLLKSHQEIILRVAKLAFLQLNRSTVIFEEKDLEECGIEAKDTLFSDTCTEILKVEPPFYVKFHKTMYEFVHLSIQEFLAAFYAFHCFSNKNLEPLKAFLAQRKKTVSEDLCIDEFLKMAVNKALDSKTGHFDLFVRFLHGFTLESNRIVLDYLLPQMQVDTETMGKITKNLRVVQRKNISAERCLNLFHCLSEMNDCSVQEEVQNFLNSEKGCVKTLSMAHCSGIAYMLQLSEVQEVFDLTKYNTSDEGRKRLVPAVKNCVKAILTGCKLTENSCDIVASALQSENSPLRELDLSDNDLQDFGMQILCTGMGSPNCKLEKLKLSCCGITEAGCKTLASTLDSNPSCLKELDLSRNSPGVKGKRMLSTVQKSLHFTMSFHDEAEHWLKSGLRKYAYKITLDPKTAHRKLRWKNQKVYVDTQEQTHPNYPEQFQHCQQFLCNEGLRGKAYWEADWNKHAVLGVAYKNIQRNGQDESKFGCNNKSWSLECFIGSYVYKHNNLTETIPAPRCRAGRVGVFLDWKSGTLSFYSISSGALSHLHTFHTKFTETLYPGFEVSNSVTLWQPTKKQGSDS